MNIIVTGGCGFIGSHIVDELLRRAGKHDNIIIIDNLFSGKEANIAEAEKDERIKFHQLGLVTGGVAVERLFDEYHPDAVFHLAAAAKIPWCSANPEASQAINVGATLHLLELSRKYKVKAFVYSSSSSIYGTVEEQVPIQNNRGPKPISLYGLQKYTSERLCSIYGMNNWLPTMSLRYFNVYGSARQSLDGPYANVMMAFIRDFKEKGKVIIYGTGDQKRDFVHVSDVVEANMLAAGYLLNKQGAFGQALNIGTGVAVSINEIAELFKYPVMYAPRRIEDPPYSCADMTETENVLDFHALVGLKQGIYKLMEDVEGK